MKTIERSENQTEDTINTSPVEAGNLGAADNWVSTERLASQRDARSPSPAPIVGKRQTMQQRVFLAMLPFVVLPVLVGGWLLAGEIIRHSSPQSEQAQLQERAEALEQREWAEIIIFLTLGLVNLGMVMWNTRQLSHSLKQVSDKLTAASDGNLDVRVEPIGTVEYQEIANSFNQLVTNFNRTLQQQQLAAKANRLYGKIALTAQQSIDRLQVYDVCVQEIQQILNADRVAIYRYQPEDGMGVIVAEALSPNTSAVLGTPLGQMYLIESPAELARYQHGQSWAIDNLQIAQLSPSRQELFASLKLRSLLSVPIVIADRLVGTIVLHQGDRQRDWQDWEVSFCAQTAQRLSAALAQIATWNAQSIELQRTNLLTQALQTNEPQELQRLLAEALEIARQEFNLDRAMVVRLNESAENRVVAMAVKPDSAPPELEQLWQYLDYECERVDFAPEEVGCIYHLDESGGLAAREIERLEGLNIKARTIAPIWIEGRLEGLAIGHLCVGTRRWQQAELDKFNTVAQRIGLAIERQQSIQQRATKRDRRNILADITLRLRQSIDLDDIIEIALSEIARALGLDRAILATATNSGALSIASEAVSENHRSILGMQLEHFQLAKQTLAIDDIHRSNLSEVQIQTLVDLPVRSFVAVPVAVNDRPFGTICAQMSQTARTWDAETIEFLEQIVAQVSLVLSQAKLFAQQENDALKAQIISNFTLQLRQSLKRQDMLDTAVELVRTALELDRAIVFELDGDFNGRVSAESVAAPEFSIVGVQIDDCCLQEAGFERGKITSTPDIYEAGLSECHIQMLEKLQVRANLVVPIAIDGNLLGLFIAHQCQAPRLWSPEEINLFNQLSTQLALALNQALLIEQREAAAHRAQILSELTLKLRQSMDETEILNLALPEIRNLLGLDRASILVVNNAGEGEGQIIAESVAAPEQSILNTIVPAEFMFEIIGKKGYKEGDCIKLDHLQTDLYSEPLIALLRSLKIESIVTTPIFVNNKFFGLFNGSMCERPRAWEQSELDLLVQFASQIGIALGQAKLLSQLELANLQQSAYATSQETARQALQKNAWDLLLQVDRISQGDLTIRAEVTDDEIGTIADSYNSTVESLRGLVQSVRNVAQEVVATSSRNEISVAELSVEAIQQAEDIRAALERIKDMTDSIQLVVNNALSAEAAVMESAELVRAGDAAMNSTVEGILTIRTTVAETAKKVKRLGESSQKISKVVNLISSFAAQTNLLALNASIEAARAGEEGRGFAVVAEEVRSLAKQSATATSEIENLVASIQAQTTEVVMAMEAGTEQVAIGTKLVEEARASLDRITSIGSKIGELVEAIAQAALLQAESSERANKSIDRVATIATKTSVRADNVQSSFQELLALAQELQKNIGQFKIE